MLRLPPIADAGIWSPVARRKLYKRAFSDIDRGVLGGLIFNARRLHSLTQAQVAAAIGRDRPWLSDVETGKIRHMPDEDVQALARTLGLDAGQLVIARDGAPARPVSSSGVLGGHRACHQCGHLSPDDANFCSHCGTEVPADIKCQTCGQLSDVSANYCMNCGSALLEQPGARSRA